MTHTINLVREFHEKFGHPVAEAPDESTEELRLLRVQLIAEELSELCQALRINLNLSVECASEEDGPDCDCVVVDATIAHFCGCPDLAEAADALGDLDYVVQGANLVFGIPAEEVVAEIHRSNMSKLGADGKPIYRDDGKILKGPNYSPPDLASIIGFLAR